MIHRFCCRPPFLLIQSQLAWGHGSSNSRYLGSVTGSSSRYYYIGSLQGKEEDEGAHHPPSPPPLGYSTRRLHDYGVAYNARQLAEYRGERGSLKLVG